MDIWRHLYLKGFMSGYKRWYLHGEQILDYASTSEPQTVDRVDEPSTDGDFGLGTMQMVNNAYRENFPSQEEDEDRREVPNLEAMRFFEMLDAAKQPLYKGCRDGHSPLSSASRLMTLKTDYNLAEECVDAIVDFVRDVLPEDNLAPGSYYEVQKLVVGLGLPYQVIDVCIDNCMIYWREDENRKKCKFCQKPRFQETSGRVPVPYKRMWYLPLTERLKRLYQSERTTGTMRWHAEHSTDAYGMLSGWATHGRLSCPYCQDNTDAFQLKHGRKTCWFDCHRRFLPHDHPYRKSTTLFTKNKKVFDSPPPEVSGTYIVEQLRDFGVESTPELGGNGHYPVGGVGEYHNWHKKSIFWDLPYWENHLLRHNLDVMHVEKNFFDNLMNTILNVQGKTKDNLKSRYDLVDICSRSELHVDAQGKSPPPIYRLDAAGKAELFDWIIHGVKFPDGYASNLRNCVDKNEGKFIGMKSYDCHVVMQRLLLFAFSGLLPRKVHEAIAGIIVFFRDLCTRSVTVDGVRNLKDNIPYRWMYVFERYMFHLKKMVKNLSKIEGSIVAQSINEETSNFVEYYFPSEVRTKSRRPSRHDDRGEKVAHCLDCGQHIDDWLREFVYGPDYVAKSYPRYCSRGYSFAVQKDGSSRRTNDSGVSSSSGDDVYYGNICEILEIWFPGMIGLRCTIFYCDWYDYTLGRGVEIDAFGVRSVHLQRKLQYYDPFILASQADQVCYIRYPRVRQRDDPWITVTSINPRGRVEGVSEPLQPNSSSHLYPTEDLAAVELVVDLTRFGEDDVVHSESEAEIGEYGNDSDSCSSDPSSDSE
ncbi:PREDICTED: uncharacterized protein LOC106330231 [Brassica oleracea var. oleracea]|uniref:uncharacterized protein LOC106330231 n=1 Tax=Brassica oleracea var. oleracea TaxID=109376 RepID=UPI0006A6BDFC|nr:PREDICTED: uncharacterized protein LOC106330231 [Brassica oleracea var. oleracea]